MIRTPDEIAPVFKRAFEIEGARADRRARRLPGQSRALVCSKAASSDGSGCIDLLDFII
jgi:hypothetical protein